MAGISAPRSARSWSDRAWSRRRSRTLALSSPDLRASADLVKSLGFDPKTQLVESLQPQIGCTGSAEALLLLAPAPRSCRAGQLILVGAYGEGADVLLFRATDALAATPRATPRERWLGAKTALPSYDKYLKFRRLIEVEEVTDVVTNVLEFKELKQDVRLYGSRCRECGQVQYPMARVCIRCRRRSSSTMPRIARAARCSRSRSTISSPTSSTRCRWRSSTPTAAAASICRSPMPTTSRSAPRWRCTYRRLHEGGGNRNYYWKARLLRERQS
jgi:hypothetical protein